MKRESSPDEHGATCRKTSFLYLCTKGCYQISYSNVIQKMRSALDHKNTLFDALSIVSNDLPHSCHARIQ